MQAQELATTLLLVGLGLLVVPVYFTQSDRDLVSRPCIEDVDGLNSWGECGGRDLP